MPSLKKLKNAAVNALIITAHPDDESLFIGGSIAELRTWRWTVLCVTDCDDRFNKRRRQELLRACRLYERNSSHIKPIMLGILKRKGRFLREDIGKKISDFLTKSGTFDVVFTHNSRGEYGHKTHKLIHNIVSRLGLRNLYNFCLPGSDKIALNPNRKRRFAKNIEEIRLSVSSLLIKKRAIHIYLRGSQKTNLSKLKEVVARAAKTASELFIKAK